MKKMKLSTRGGSALREKNKKLPLLTLADTERLAWEIAATLRGAEVIALSGSLGAGKTTFTQALGRALGIKKEVKSPTFVVMHVHKINAKRITHNAKLKTKFLCHVDAYRIEELSELETIGLQDYLGNPEVITVIEWAEKIKKILPKETLWLTFAYAKQGRSVTVKNNS